MKLKEERVAILFIGGDERQKRATHGMSVDHAEVAYMHPRWNRNWSKALGEVQSRLQHAPPDIVVISTDVPTLLGRAIRKACRTVGVPWRSVRARGKGAIERVLADARDAVLAQRRRLA